MSKDIVKQLEKRLQFIGTIRNYKTLIKFCIDTEDIINSNGDVIAAMISNLSPDKRNQFLSSFSNLTGAMKVCLSLSQKELPKLYVDEVCPILVEYLQLMIQALRTNQPLKVVVKND